MILKQFDAEKRIAQKDMARVRKKKLVFDDRKTLEACCDIAFFSNQILSL